MDKHKIYLEMASVVSKLSKDKGTKVGAVIISDKGTPVSFGYNGMLAGVDESMIPDHRDNREYEFKSELSNQNINSDLLLRVNINKYPFIYHAESNAIWYADKEKLKGSTLYITHVPCIHCAKEIARSGIKTIRTCEYEDTDENSSVGTDFNETLMIYATAGITIYVGNTCYKPRLK